MPPNTNNISISILTLNEETSILRCLKSVSWSNDIVILDSFSTDGTKNICKEVNHTRFFQRKFDDYSSQRNFALHEIEYKHDWVFIIDADEICPTELANEMNRKVLESSSDIDAFLIRRKDYFLNKWMQHNNMYPVWLERLVRPKKVKYERSINERLVFDKEGPPLKEHIHHYPFTKGIDYWLERHNKYSSMEVENRFTSKEPIILSKLFSRNPTTRRKALKNLSFHLPARFFIFFLHNFFFKLCFLDGKKGVYFILLKTYYEFMIDVKSFVYTHKHADSLDKSKNNFETLK